MLRFNLILLTVLFIGCQTTKNQLPVYQQKIGPIGDKAMVSSAHPLATKVGVEVLKNGGNAVDAAIAVQFALAVVFPRAGNIGGGGFAVIRMNDGAISSLDFREKAPLAASRDMYLDEDGNVIPDLSTKGHKAAGVPGSVDGMFKLHEKYGSKPIDELIQPAINLAYYGYVLTDDAAKQIGYKKQDLIDVNGTEFFLAKEWNSGDRTIIKIQRF